MIFPQRDSGVADGVLRAGGLHVHQLPVKTKPDTTNPFKIP
jgi:hypothetical protein